MCKIKSKIAALLAKANSTTNEHEQTAFMSKVNQLLEKHQMSIFELDNGDDPLVHENGEINIYASKIWMKAVVTAIARYYNCRAVFWRNGTSHTVYKLMGRESAVITTELMLPFIIKQIGTMAKEYAAEYGVTMSIAQRNMGVALASRVWGLIKDKDITAPIEIGKGLVSVDEVDAYMESLYPDLGDARAIKGSSGAAKAMASGISLHRQTSGTTTKLIG